MHPLASPLQGQIRRRKPAGSGRVGRCLLSCLTALLYLESAHAQTGSFGSEQAGEAGLVGILYDFKQNQQRHATGVSPQEYPTIIQEFLSRGWDEGVFNRYFRCVRALHTTQIFIPHMGAGEAPKAFGVENVVKPSCWVAHYKGQVSPPETGRYRFVGCSDDLIAVAIDGQTVLAQAMFGLKVWKSSEQQGAQAANNRLVYGDWLDLMPNKIVDLDVLIGERPGGFFNAFLLYQKEGAIYPLDEKGNPILPVFQLAEALVPALPTQAGPEHSITLNKPWKGF